MTGKLDIPLRGSSVYIVKKRGAALSDILNSKFGCVATFNGVEFENETSFTQRRKPTVVPEERFVIKFKGVEVSVWKADLTSFKVDAVVNAANEHLQHYGGLAQALSDAGGPEIQKESDNYVTKNPSLRTGDAVTLGAGSLPCKKIIHAVGPDLPMNPTQNHVRTAQPLLRKAIQNILFEADINKLGSVAIPAISSGLFHYPLPACADTIVSVVKDYCENSSSQRRNPKKIQLVNHDEPTVREMERACHQVFGSHPAVSYSQAAASKTRAASSSSAFSVQVGNILLILKKGKIEDQKTDVIVNTASTSRDLSKGQISNAIFQKAGYEMQLEIYKADKKSSIICTKPHSLGCKEVYHTFCVERFSKEGQFGAGSQLLHDSVFECLWTAANRGHKSISFPAIGTGALGFSKEESAMIMLNAVIDFVQRNPHRLEVFFVIFPSDNETFQAFERQLRHFQQTASLPSFAPAPEARKELRASQAPNPQISLRGPTEESTREAEKWLNDLLCLRSHDVQIQNNFILHFSEQDHLELSLLTERGVKVEEFYSQGHACITVSSRSKEEAAVAALEVEATLCKIQKEFVSEEKQELQLLSNMEVSFERQNVDFSHPKFSDRKRAFKDQRLWVLKVEKVENSSLKKMFDVKKKQLDCFTTEKMFQCIPAQFCEMISLIGFHAECAPPEDTAFGEGIYFAHTVKKAMELWRASKEEYVYFVQAEVLTGKSAPGKPGLILPPVGQDPNVIHHSVGGPEVTVIFSGYQALPKYIYICKRM